MKKLILLIMILFISVTIYSFELGGEIRLGMDFLSYAFYDDGVSDSLPYGITIGGDLLFSVHQYVDLGIGALFQVPDMDFSSDYYVIPVYASLKIPIAIGQTELYPLGRFGGSFVIPLDKEAPDARGLGIFWSAGIGVIIAENMIIEAAYSANYFDYYRYTYDENDNQIPDSNNPYENTMIGKLNISIGYYF